MMTRTVWAEWARHLCVENWEGDRVSGQLDLKNWLHGGRRDRSLVAMHLFAGRRPGWLPSQCQEGIQDTARGNPFCTVVFIPLFQKKSETF